MLRIMLTFDERAAVEALRRAPYLRPAERDRVEMLLLAANGWSAPQIATHFHCCEQTVRRLLHRWATAGPSALHRQRPGPAPDWTRRERVTAALARLVGQDRTWTAGQLAVALHAAGIELSARQVRRYLHDLDARWRRTARTLRHKQDPARVATAKDDLAALKKAPRLAS